MEIDRTRNTGTADVVVEYLLQSTKETELEMFFNLMGEIYNKQLDQTSRDVICYTTDRMKLARFCKFDTVPMLMACNYSLMSHEAHVDNNNKSFVRITTGEYYLIFDVGTHWLMNRFRCFVSTIFPIRYQKTAMQINRNKIWPYRSNNVPQYNIRRLL
jgi:hypothetical protein